MVKKQTIIDMHHAVTEREAAYLYAWLLATCAHKSISTETMDNLT